MHERDAERVGRSDAGDNARRHNADRSATHQALIRHERLAGGLTPMATNEDESSGGRQRKARHLISPYNWRPRKEDEEKKVEECKGDGGDDQETKDDDKESGRNAKFT
ncbi:hypothetical protein E2C01_073587 [Portunus trituberculatus]|uniref:Uncharacterized protein n=1 Tax=Portunus trituberculatus TaxID=210409 RepID=A0A5B7IA47_PORTR|nr:hypothetical protein [Portunus trituberculatus]